MTAPIDFLIERGLKMEDETFNLNHREIVKKKVIDKKQDKEKKKKKKIDRKRERESKKRKLVPLI